MFVSEEDRLWIAEHYPKLTLSEINTATVIVGYFEFVAAYDESIREYIINPPAIRHDELVCVHDIYHIELTIPKDESQLPVVRELDGRIKAVAEKLRKQLRDLHIYPSGQACLVGHLDLRPLKTLPDFVDRAVLQYFYDQSSFEQFGWWPRGFYSHGLLGLLENYIDRFEHGAVGLEEECVNQLLHSKTDEDFNRIIERLCSKSRIGSHLPCICGSGKAYRGCPDHQRVYRALWQLQKHVRDQGLKPLLLRFHN